MPLSDSGRPTHVDLNANAAPQPSTSARERLASIQYHLEHRHGWETVEMYVSDLDWLATLAEEALDARENR